MSDPYAANVSLLVPFEYSTTNPQDYSPNKKQLIPVGAATPDTQDSKFYGKSVSFDGRTGYIDIPPSQDFNFGTGDYTVEFWIKILNQNSPESFPGYIRVICPRLTFYGAGAFQLWFANTTAPTYSPINVIALAAPGATTNICNTITPVNDAEWHHVAFVRVGGIAKCYLDGTFKSEGADTTDYSLAGAEGFRIGARADKSINQYMCGNLQDLRITKGVCRYTGNFTPPDRFLSDTNLSGTVLTTEGLPKSGMTVRCIDRNPKIQRMWTTKTDKFGHYSFLLPKGDYAILAQDDNGNLNDQVKRVRN